MSEYVFNAASSEPAQTNRDTGDTLAATLLQTLAELDSRLLGPARPLKLPRNPWDLPFAQDAQGHSVSLGEIVNGFYESGATRDLAVFFDALQWHAPAVDQLDEPTIEAILRLAPSAPAEGYEGIFQAVCDAGYDAMQCVVTGGTLVSIAGPRWDFDQAVVRNGTDLVEFDHASRPPHVDAIFDRQQQAARAAVTRQNFEGIRHSAFPLLAWGRDITGQIATFPSEYLGLAFKRLAKLDDIVRRWRASGDAEPDTNGMEFKNETALTMDNYGEERRFRSASGAMRTYEKHVWIDRGNRIHFVIDHLSRGLEIGYIGPHLKTWTN